ncbi:MAG: hypothetical protein VCG02_15515 [Verrucomicrobiota bacterium]
MKRHFLLAGFPAQAPDLPARASAIYLPVHPPRGDKPLIMDANSRGRQRIALLFYLLPIQ